MTRVVFPNFEYSWDMYYYICTPLWDVAFNVFHTSEPFSHVPLVLKLITWKCHIFLKDICIWTKGIFFSISCRAMTYLIHLQKPMGYCIPEIHSFLHVLQMSELMLWTFCILLGCLYRHQSYISEYSAHSWDFHDICACPENNVVWKFLTSFHHQFLPGSKFVPNVQL